MSSKVAIVAQGIFERSDSIAYDCLWQFDRLREMYPQTSVRVFAEKIHTSRYADWPVESLDRLWPWIEGDTPSTVLYHYCDGWPSLETRLMRTQTRVIVRWHNNTPPWFFAAFSSHSTANTTRGFQRVLCLAERAQTEFWVNSSYSARQLSFLGVPENRTHVVYPASAYLAYPRPTQSDPSRPRHQRRTIRLLFVGRVTPHKGHKHLIAVSALVQSAISQKVELHLVGRTDPSMQCYVDELSALARKLSVPLSMHGEIGHTNLHRLYEQCDVFLALSEHEGFGLPLFEAMRLGIPVVALRSTAISDLLCGHPLGVDLLDYREIALRVVAALDPKVREIIVAWQREQILGGYDAEIVARQLKDGIEGRSRWPAGSRYAPCPLAGKSVEALRAALWTRLDNAFSSRNTLRELPKDTPERFVTRYDIAAYSALLGSHGTRTNLYDATLAQGFASGRPFLGLPLRLARRVALSVQSGLVGAMSILDANVSARFERMERLLSRLQGSLEAMQAPHASRAACHTRSSSHHGADDSCEALSHALDGAPAPTSEGRAP